MSPIQTRTRREALAAIIATGFAPALLPSRLFGATAPSKQITLGCIGVGSHGFGVNLKSFLNEPAARVAAVCDVFADRRERARQAVNAAYKDDACKAVADFREIIADKSIDAVVISTPDHWHVPISLLALEAGKDVFCEKPTLTIAEGRELAKAVEARKAVFQTGLEDRSLTRYHLLAELVRNGVIGTLRRIKVGLPPGVVFKKENPSTPPAGMDYNLWLGPAPWRPYDPVRVSSEGWRMIRDYSGGKLTDWGAHLIDTAQVANGSEKTGPVDVEGHGETPKDALTDVPTRFNLRYRYANGVDMEVNGNGVLLRFEGDKGWIGNRGWEGPFEASDMALLHTRIDPAASKFWPRPPREHRNFLDCVISRRPTTYPAEDLQRLCTTLHLGSIAMSLGRKLRWNPETEGFINDPEADALRSRASRNWEKVPPQ
ncbi:MAG: Gfo/Idh/MocA family oxidoreductase [Verrucomicrobia bacterium]|nr:Gfo/Idh/MocA family oxidoreductase [Verrucomicrobiota bacterium]